MNVEQHGPPAVTDLDDLARRLPLADASRALVPQARAPAEYLHLLRERRRDADAVRVVAYTLPVRAAVWWGVLSAWYAGDGSPSPAEDRALAAAAQWVVTPTEARRQAAEAAHAAAGLDTPAGCCAKAAGAAGAAAPGGRFVPGQPLVTARLVNGAVFLARGLRSAFDPAATHRQFLVLGLQVAEGRLAWDLPPVPAAAPLGPAPRRKP